MFSNRKMINENDINKLYNELIKDNINKVTYEIKLNPKNILITFINNKISSTKKIDNINKIINNNKINIFIINYKQSNATIVSRVWKELIKFNIEVFYDYELIINLIDNILIPKHELLIEDQKKKFIDEYKIQFEQLPILLLYDPISRYYNYKINDIIRIIRPSLTSGKAISYRLVKQGPLPEL